VQGLAALGAEVLPPPVLTGGIHLNVATFLGLAERAGMSLTDVVASTQTQQGNGESAPAGANPTRGRERNLSPMALKAQRAWEESAEAAVRGRTKDEGGGASGPMAHWVGILEKSVEQNHTPPSGSGAVAGGTPEVTDNGGYAEAVAWADVLADIAPKSSTMGAVRGYPGLPGVQRDRNIAEAVQQEERKMLEEERYRRAEVARRDAELVMQIVTTQAWHQKPSKRTRQQRRQTGAWRQTHMRTLPLWRALLTDGRLWSPGAARW
jgi:hypothetical protein